MTAYEMRISDWSSDVCSSDLRGRMCAIHEHGAWHRVPPRKAAGDVDHARQGLSGHCAFPWRAGLIPRRHRRRAALRSEEHTSELQSLMRISYAVFCLKKKTKRHTKETRKTIVQTDNN